MGAMVTDGTVATMTWRALIVRRRPSSSAHSWAKWEGRHTVYLLFCTGSA